MLINYKLAKYITSGIIAPHGVTDLIHAKQNNNISKLLQIYTYTNGSFIILNSLHQEMLINVLFVIGSTIHFQNDIPIKNTIFRCIFTNLMILYFIFFDNNSIILYLSLIHVPNHYISNWFYLKKEKNITFILLFITTLLSLYFGNEYFELYNDLFISDIIKGIIVSHVLYQELYIL